MSNTGKVAACLAMMAGSIVTPAASADLVPVDVSSPDGKNSISLTTAGQPPALGLKISRDGSTLIEITSLVVRLAEGGELSGAASIDHVMPSGVDEKFSVPWGKAKEIVSKSQRAEVYFVNSQGTKWCVELAAFDDGVAYRYVLPEQEKVSQFTLTGESGDLKFGGVPTLHYTAWDTFANDHESEFRRDTLTGVRGPLVDLPLLAVWPGGMAAGFTEARVRDFTNLYLEPDKNPDLGVLHLRLSPLPGKADACVTGRTPHSSPWRVVLLGDRAGSLLESNLLVSLNDPPSGDFSWAKPGKTTWHWWNGTFDRGPEHMNFESHKRYIDFCAKYGIAYHAVVSDLRPWHVQPAEGFEPGDGTDVCTARPELDLPKIIKYARKKGVGIRLWVHYKALDPRLEEAFKKYEDWGISGLMIDFLNSDNQETVKFCERALDCAARHKLHIQFHGSYKPSGEQRTWPNLFNREGVLNLEYLKWSKRCPPPHDVEVAYVRQLAGPLDFHTGGFNAVPDMAFVPRNENPAVLGTRCHMLAMYVVYENPMPMMADTPDAYEGQNGFDFIVKVPTTWDESRFVAGEAGEYIVMARRNGDKWYLGGMTNWTPREISVPLGFLGPGDYEARIYADDSTGKGNPNGVDVRTTPVKSDTPLSITMAPGGGFTAIIAPK